MPPRSSTPKPLLLLTGDRAAGETDSAVIACNDWLRLGPGRTLPLLLSKYTKTRRNAPPTTSLDTLKDWSRRFAWKDRAPIYDQAGEDAKNARRDAVLNEGLALDYERVARLKYVAAFLERQMLAKMKHTTEEGTVRVTYDNLWVPDVKTVGAGETATRVDVVHFNGALVGQWRGTLSDLAAERAGRGSKKDGEGSDPLERLRRGGTDYGQFSDVELTAMLAEAEALADESAD